MFLYNFIETQTELAQTVDVNTSQEGHQAGA